MSVKHEDGEIRCLHPVNMMLCDDDLLTFYNPADILIYNGKKEVFESHAKKSGKLPSVVTFERADSFKSNHQRASEFYRFPRDAYDPPDRMEVELYFNMSLNYNYDPIDDLLKFAQKYPNVLFHVKYAVGDVDQDYDKYVHHNNNPGSPLYFTPFTTMDWKVFNRNLAALQRLQRDEFFFFFFFFFSV